jgi:hypothetical protein
VAHPANPTETATKTAPACSEKRLAFTSDLSFVGLETIQVKTRRQTNSSYFYNTVLFLQQQGKITTAKLLGFKAFLYTLKEGSS